MAMLAWAQQQVGKPFSSMGMMRSMIWPRTTDGQSWYATRLEPRLAHICSSVHMIVLSDANPLLFLALAGTAPSSWPRAYSRAG